MTAADIPWLRREVGIAQSAYTHAHDTYWTTRHDEAVFQIWHATAIRLDHALTAVLAALPHALTADREPPVDAEEQGIQAHVVGDDLTARIAAYQGQGRIDPYSRPELTHP